MNSAAVPGIDAGRRRRQLPAEVSAFVGRTDELAALAGLLRRGRLVTVTGPGGVGKTRLALRAAADAADRYADGTRLVEPLRPGRRGTAPGGRGGQGLGLRGHDPRPARAAVLDHLRGQRLLLILDTCEHLAAAVARFAAQRAADDRRDHDPDHQQAAAARWRASGSCGSARCRCRSAGREPGAGRRGRAVRHPRRRRAARVHDHRRGTARRDQDLPAARRHPARRRARRRPGAGAAAGRAGRPP